MKRDSVSVDAWNFYLVLLSFLIALAILFPAFKKAREEGRHGPNVSSAR